MEETNHCKAKEGYTFKRKVDNFIMGNELYLGLFIDGTEDIIDNYEEVVDDSPKEETEMDKLNEVQNKVQ